MIEIQRILSKFDSLMLQKDFEEAERLLGYWICECEADNDKRNLFTLRNELVGFYRMRLDKEKGLKACDDLKKLTKEMGLENEVSGATAFINIATAYKSFELPDEALPLYEKAQAVYENALEPTDSRLPALYNNMALTFMSFDSYEFRDKAETYFIEALDRLKTIAGSENEQAITYLNMSDLAQLRYGSEEAEEMISNYIENAYTLLEKSHSGNNPDFKMTAEKCIPVFGHYGYFMMANNLKAWI